MLHTCIAPASQGVADEAQCLFDLAQGKGPPAQPNVNGNPIMNAASNPNASSSASSWVSGRQVANALDQYESLCLSLGLHSQVVLPQANFLITHNNHFSCSLLDLRCLSLAPHPLSHASSRPRNSRATRAQPRNGFAYAWRRPAWWWGWG